jgi:hypothetical protein
MTFVFGMDNWLLGYCVLYFLVSVFVGWIIIDKHFPLKHEKIEEPQRKRTFNALKTP